MPEASLSLGALLAQRGDLAAAREVLLAAASAQPGLAALQYNLALVAFLGGDANEARDRCGRALALDGAHAGARELLTRLERR
jgi:Flp pilus assembly protein TadD